MPKLGETTLDSALLGRRDAMHVACVLASCDEGLFAGTKVRFTDETRRVVERAGRLAAQGVVDPFLPTSTAGELFWVLLFPHLVHGLHHDFEIGPPPEIGDDSPFDEDVADLRAEYDAEREEREDFRIVGGRSNVMDSDGCSGSWCDGH